MKNRKMFVRQMTRRTVGSGIAIALWDRENKWSTLAACRDIVARYMWARRRYIHAGGDPDAAEAYAGDVSGLHDRWFVKTERGIKGVASWANVDPDPIIVARLGRGSERDTTVGRKRFGQAV